MDRKLLYVLLAVFISSSSYAVTKHHGFEPKMFSSRLHNFNNCEILITNYGRFGDWFGYWPTGSGNAYIYAAGIWIGGIKDGDTLVSCSSMIGAGDRWMPGPPDHNDDHSAAPTSHPEDRIYLSTDSIDLREWPLRDSASFPIILSGQDGWGEYNDLWMKDPEWEPDEPLGLWVKQHSFCWRFPSPLEDMLFVLYEIENISGDSLRAMYIGIGADMDVGWADDDLVGYDIDLGMGYTYTSQQEPSFGQPPYYVSVTVLKGPRASDTVYVRDGPWDPSYPSAVRDTVLPDSQLVLTSMTGYSRGYYWYYLDTDEGKYLTLAGYKFDFSPPRLPRWVYDPWPEEDRVPDDKIMIPGCGPFELEPGEVDTFLIAVMFSDGHTGGLDYFRAQTAIGRSLVRTITHDPLIRVAFPNGGEEISGSEAITWETLGEEIDRVDLYLSSDSGRTWSNLAIGLRNTGSHLWNSRIVADGSYLLKICGQDSLLFTWDLSDGEFSVNNLHRESLPVYSFPNPFSRSTTIMYYVPHQMEVSLTIYDGAGRSVKRPVCGVRTSGMDAVVWDATDSSGRKVPSGTYFVRLEAHAGQARQYTATRKLCVVR